MSRPTIGGTLDLAALAKLTGNPDRSRMAHFESLSRDEKAAAIRRMAAEGWTDHSIASACRLAVEQIRRVLAERGETTP